MAITKYATKKTNHVYYDLSCAGCEDAIPLDGTYYTFPFSSVALCPDCVPGREHNAQMRTFRSAATGEHLTVADMLIGYALDDLRRSWRRSAHNNLQTLVKLGDCDR